MERGDGQDTTNKEHEEEKKKEQDEFEKKVGVKHPDLFLFVDLTPAPRWVTPWLWVKTLKNSLERR